MRALISAVLIVRDEEAVLEACLSSLDGVVDEIVIVDTGSVDETMAICRRHRVSLFEQEWRDDFAEARNASLDRASGEWILYIDADERVIEADRVALETTLRTTDQVAFRVLLRPHSTMTPYREYRLWRNDPRIRFEGRMHERVVPAIHQVALLEGSSVGDIDLFLDHVGYEGDQMAKHRRNLPLLERYLADDPEHLFALHHLATVLEALDRDNEVDPLLERAIDVVRRQAVPQPVGSLAFGTLIRRRQARGEDVGDLLAEALALFPGNCVLLFTDGRVLASDGQFEAALVRFDAIVDEGRQPVREGTPSYNRQLVGELTQASRGLCLFRLERFEEAAAAYAAAGASAPEDPTYAIRRDLAHSRARRSAVAPSP